MTAYTLAHWRVSLRLDLPFIPHVALANTPTPEACKAIVDHLNAADFEIRGWVEALDVIGYDGERVWPIVQVTLPGARRKALVTGLLNRLLCFGHDVGLN